MSRTKKKGCNPLVGILVLGGFVLIGIVVVAFVGNFMLQNWIKGDGLQSLLKEKTEAQLKANIEFGDIKWEGMKAYAGSLKARGYEDAAFSKLDLNGVQVNINVNGLKNRVFDVSSISLSQAKAEISNDRLAGLFPIPAAPESSDSSSIKMPGWFKGKMPNRVEIGDIEIGSVTFDIKDDNGTTMMAIKESKATIKPNLDNGVIEIAAEGGRLQLPAPAPKLNIRSASARFNGNHIFINDASLEVYDGGHVGGLGEIEIGDVPKVDLDLNVSNIDIKNVLTGDWKNRVSGTIRGPVKVSGTVDNLVQKGTIHLDNGLLESIPVLDKIGEYTKKRRFSRLVLNQAQADFTLTGDLLELRNIQIESDGLVRVEGVVDKQGEVIAGVLSIGITPGTLSMIPGAERTVFTEKRDGFVWTTMNIGGANGQIREDLSNRLIGAAAVDIVDRLPASVQDKIKGFLGGNNPNQPPTGNGDPTDQVKDLLIDEAGETGKKLIKGLGTLFGQ